MLVVEDEPLISMMLEDMLAEVGCAVVGVAASLKKGLELAHTARFDVAILDVTLGRESSFPIADLLREKGVPFLFASGHGDGLPEPHADRVMLTKPYDLSELAGKLNLALAR